MHPDLNIESYFAYIVFNDMKNQEFEILSFEIDWKHCIADKIIEIYYL